MQLPSQRTTSEVRDKWRNLTSAAKGEVTNFGKEIDMFDVMFKNTPSLLPPVESNPAADQVGNNTNMSVF